MPAFDQNIWDAWEDATLVGHVIYLYKFAVSGMRRTTAFHYCTGTTNITYDGAVYRPWPCIHKEIKHTVDDSTASVDLAASKGWISILFENTPRKVEVSIYRYKTDIDMAFCLFNGEVRKHSLEVNRLSLSCGSSFAAANTDLLLYYTQRFCNHAQYQYFCGMQFDSYAVVIPPGKWSLTTRKTIKLADEYDLDGSYWKELIILYESRFTENGEELLFELDNLAVSVSKNIIGAKFPVSCNTDPERDALTIAPNCMMNLQRCRDVFGNLPRSCAWPDMPLKNFAAIDVEQSGKGTGGPLGPPAAR